MTIAKTEEVGSPAPRPIAHGETACREVSQSENIKVCPHAWCGCLSLNGDECCVMGPCDPCDEFGRFTPREYWYEDQRFTTKDRRVLAPVIEAEDDLIPQTSSLSARDIEELCRRQDELLPRTFTFRGMRITEEAF